MEHVYEHGGVWDDLTEVLVRLRADVGPAAVTATRAAELVPLVAQARRRLEAIEMDLAARVSETSVWRSGGAASAAEWYARQRGSSTGEARAVLATAQALEQLPTARAELDAGQLSMTQASIVAEAASAAPGAEVELVAAAHRDTLKGLRDAAGRAKAAADPDPVARHARIHARRSLSTWCDADGTGRLAWSGTTEALAQIRAGLDRARRPIFDQARRQGRRERPEAYDADALVALAAGGPGSSACFPVGSRPAIVVDPAAGGSAGRPGATTDVPGLECRPAASRAADRSLGSQAKVVVRIDHAALFRGRAEPGETCEITGVGPVPVPVVHELLADGAFLAAVTTHHEVVHGVAHLGRAPTAKQRTALDWSAPVCAAAGCGRPVREIDHREDWAVTHHTKLDELDGLCRHCHWLKTVLGWRLVVGTGVRPLRPPGHPEHPGPPGRGRVSPAVESPRLAPGASDRRPEPLPLALD